MEVSDGADDTLQQQHSEDLAPSPPPRSSSYRGPGIECDARPSGLSLSLLNLLGNSEGCRRSSTATPACQSQAYAPPPHPNGAAPDGSPEAAQGVLYPCSRSARSALPFTFPIAGPRRLFVMRHGERADFTFGEWCKICFDKDGRYSRADLNLQASVPSRADMPLTFVKDCPLTRIGEFQAQLVGEGFAATHTPVHHVFVSPSLRCIMTATRVLKAMNLADKLPLKIEPGLFEWLAWYPEGAPRFMTNDELIAAGFNIDVSYRPVMPAARLPTDEMCEQYYNRSNLVTSSILADTKNQGGTVLLVAHAASLDTCIKQLVGGLPRNSAAMTQLVLKVPYCAVAAAQESSSEGVWAVAEPPFRSPTHSSNHSYDWTIWRH